MDNNYILIKDRDTLIKHLNDKSSNLYRIESLDDNSYTGLISSRMLINLKMSDYYYNNWIDANILYYKIPLPNINNIIEDLDLIQEKLK